MERLATLSLRGHCRVANWSKSGSAVTWGTGRPKERGREWMVGEIVRTQTMFIKFTILYGHGLWCPITITIITSKITDHAAAATKSLQSCPTLCDSIEGSPPGSPIPGFSRQEHWSGLPFPSPMHESEKMKVKSLSRVRLLATPRTAAHQTPPSMGFSRQEYLSGVPLPSPSLIIDHPKNITIMRKLEILQELIKCDRDMK